MIKEEKMNWFYTENIFNIPRDFKFDLQRFASAEAEGRTEKATEHKKKKAREEGRVALSKEVPAVVVTLLSFIVIYFSAKYFFTTLYGLFRYVYENMSEIDITRDNFFISYCLTPFLKLFAPVAITAFLSAIFSNYLQIGLKFTIKAIKPDFKKISPNIFKYLKNQVFSITGFFNLIKSIVKIGIIMLVAFITISSKIEFIKNILFVENIFDSFLFIAKLIFSLVFRTMLVLMAFSIVDILFTKWQFEEQLKMKKEEVKEEYKELYGDPQVRSRLKQMYQNILSQKKMLEEVPKSDVVITNPTHYAVALKYDRHVDEAPRVTAKGKDAFAMKIKEEAKRNNIYMYENIALARSLYNEVEVNDVIPRTMYGLVINAYKLAMQQKELQNVG